MKVPAIDPGVGIRATVIGASQFTVQVSGTTIFVTDFGILPMRNVRVVGLHIAGTVYPGAIAERIKAGLERNNMPDDGIMALAIEWNRPPRYPDLRDTQ